MKTPITKRIMEGREFVSTSRGTLLLPKKRRKTALKKKIKRKKYPYFKGIQKIVGKCRYCKKEIDEYSNMFDYDVCINCHLDA